MRPARHSVVILAATILAGCGAGTEEFVPTEGEAGQTIEGYEEAVYDLMGTAGRFGEAKISSEGAYVVDTDVGPRTVIQLGVTVENTGTLPIRIPDGAVNLESVNVDNRRLRNLTPNWVRGPRVIPPGEVEDIRFFFALPRGVDPGDIDAFRARWMARANGQRYAEFTPFVQTEPRYAYVPVHGYYYPYSWYGSPFYDPYWGVGYDVRVVDPYPRRVTVRGR